jgi:ABC-type multidrug transport system permease subunit
MLLANGSLTYFGSASDASEFCQTKGYPCPKEYHIADHLLDFAAVQSKDCAEDEGSLRRRIRPSPSKEFEPALSHRVSDVEKVNSFVSFLNSDTSLLSSSLLTQMEQVFWRSWKVFWRNPLLFWSHIVLAGILGFFIGFVYYKVDNSLGGIQNRLGSIFFLQSLLAFAGLSAISSLESDKLLFVRERSNGFYGYFPYFVTKVVFDIIPLRVLPCIVMSSISYFLIGFNPEASFFFKYLLVMILFSVNAGLYSLAMGCAISESSTSTLAASISILFQMLFAGILVNQVQIPVYIQWIQYISFFKYAYEACVASDAQGLRLIDQIAGVQFTVPASLVLSKFGLDVEAYYRDLGVCVAISVVFLALIGTLINYKLRERK